MGVAVAVARDEHHRAIPQPPEQQRSRGLAIRRAHHLAAGDVEAGKLRQTAAADDREHRLDPGLGKPAILAETGRDIGAC
jgi:hypothetical protein